MGKDTPGGSHERKQTPSHERYLMAQLTKFPEEAARLDLDPADLADPDHRAIFEQLRGGHSTADLPAHLAATAGALGALGAEPRPGGCGGDSGHGVGAVPPPALGGSLGPSAADLRAAFASAG